jgi:hypothetical protein
VGSNGNLIVEPLDGVLNFEQERLTLASTRVILVGGEVNNFVLMSFTVIKVSFQSL